MVEQIEVIAKAEIARRIESVTVLIGAYSGVEPDAFEFAFPFAAENTLAEKAELIIQTVPVRIECSKCRAISEPEPTWLVCGKCGSTDIALIGGREFMIQSVELEIG